jgi:hypothetical protein
VDPGHIEALDRSSDEVGWMSADRVLGELCAKNLQPSGIAGNDPDVQASPLSPLCA